MPGLRQADDGWNGVCRVDGRRICRRVDKEADEVRFAPNYLHVPILFRNFAEKNIRYANLRNHRIHLRSLLFYHGHLLHLPSCLYGRGTQSHAREKEGEEERANTQNYKSCYLWRGATNWTW